MSEQAAALAERLPVGEGVIEGGGRVATERHLHLVEEPETRPNDLVHEEVMVLSVISEGNTIGQVAERLGMSKRDVVDHRSSAASKYGVKGVTATVNRAILDGYIPIRVEPDQDTASRISDLDKRMLGLYARGFSNHWFAAQYEKYVGLEAIETYHDGLLERVGAWNRPHAIRRMYELGIWQA